jgi:Cu/Ag efflux protein CusF
VIHASNRAMLVFGAALALWLTTACGPSGSESAPPAQPQEAAPAQPQEATPGSATPARVAHAFRGTVQAVDPAAKTLTVLNENVEGWMMPMSMSYSADKDDVYGKVRVGDKITATVYDGDFKMLYNVQVAQD